MMATGVGKGPGALLVRLAFAAQMAMHGVFANPLRSFLTVLGVGIGVASVVSLMGIGEGARLAVVRQFERLGANVIEIKVEDPKNVRLDPKDAADIVERVPSLTAATPVLRGTLPVKWRFTRGAVTVVGVDASYPEVRDQALVDGHFFTPFHVDARANVAVVGYTIGRTLLGGRSPVGHTIEIAGRDFLIMGVLAPRGPDNEENVDEEILIPYTDAMTLMAKESADEIWAKAKSAQDATLAVVQLGRIYKRKLGLDTSAPTTVPGGGPGASEGAPGEGGAGGGVGVPPGEGGGPIEVPPGEGGP
ncbi:MAG: ABC transporter permease, partial [Clostridia bacterium]|nr:ABC transporter permease [Clostridia bacterium]